MLAQKEESILFASLNFGHDWGVGRCVDSSALYQSQKVQRVPKWLRFKLGKHLVQLVESLRVNIGNYSIIVQGTK